MTAARATANMMISGLVTFMDYRSSLRILKSSSQANVVRFIDVIR